MKKDYEAPAIVFVENIEGRAGSCALADEGACTGGPYLS